jgi:hypothetical protein
MLCVDISSVSGKMAEWSKAPALGVAENREIDLQYYRIRWSERAWVRTPLFSSLRFFWCTRVSMRSILTETLDFLFLGASMLLNRALRSSRHP